ncbi:MAG: hypothetical protein JKY93_03285 [Gammaproteobacteria bacterium]|nr:hypothetical protein [Gammaproteobacteria bacterium]
MRSHLIIFTVFILAACASYDLTVTSKFRPTKSGFEFQSIADAVYPNESAIAEGKRIKRLEQYLIENQICPKGYLITNRQAIQKNFGNKKSPIHDIFYTGRCK